MDSLIIYFLPTILALGIVTSYEDINEGKIRNKYVVAGLVLSILIHSVLLFSGIIDLKYIVWIFIYVLVSSITSFFIWYTELWSAGDAKLFICYTSLIPLTVYKHLTIDFPIFALIVNTVTPIFIYLVIKLLIKTSTKQKLKALKTTLNLRYILELLLVVFSMSWITRYIFNYFGIIPNYLYNILGIILLAKIAYKLAGEQTIALLVFISIIRIFLNKEYILSQNFLLSFMITVLGYAFIRLFIWDLSRFYTNKVNVYELKEGMIPVEKITIQGLKSEKKISKLFDRNIALTKKKITSIQNAHRAGKLHFNHLIVQQTIPFAPFIFLGVIITILLEGNMIIFLKMLI